MEWSIDRAAPFLLLLFIFAFFVIVSSFMASLPLLAWITLLFFFFCIYLYGRSQYQMLYCLHACHHLAFGSDRPKWVQLQGHARLPSRVYYEDSRIISVEFRVVNSELRLLHPAFTARESFDHDNAAVSLTALASAIDALELELVAGGCEIAGNLMQSQLLDATRINFQWSCHFPKSGTHEIALVARQVTSTGKVDLGRVEHSVRVVKFGPFTQRQVWVVASISAVFAGVIAVAKTLQELGLF
ncbi:hypothetical protein [Longimicrobium sp.]|jgi:hypothetical protein|uniref:hypothetical protein n=1 Tax=Longimicrobium sp. TaxID=2029185 RepID=UPI002EDAFB13